MCFTAGKKVGETKPGQSQAWCCLPSSQLRGELQHQALASRHVTCCTPALRTALSGEYWSPGFPGHVEPCSRAVHVSMKQSMWHFCLSWQGGFICLKGRILPKERYCHTADLRTWTCHLEAAVTQRKVLVFAMGEKKCPLCLSSQRPFSSQSLP